MVLCQVCNASTYPIHYETRKQTITFHGCDSCGFTVKDPADILTAAEEHSVYQRHNNSITNGGYVRFLNNFLKKAALPFARGRRCLDFGSGPEPVLAQLLERDHGCAVDVYDKFYSPERVFEGKTYDLITCTEVLEHIHDPAEAFRVFSEAMHGRSVLSLMTLLRPAEDSEFLRWPYLRDATHSAFYTLEAFRHMAGRFGLRILYTDESRLVTLVRDECGLCA